MFVYCLLFTTGLTAEIVIVVACLATIHTLSVWFQELRFLYESDGK